MGDVVSITTISPSASIVSIRCTVGNGVWDALTSSSPNSAAEVVSIVRVKDAA